MRALLLLALLLPAAALAQTGTLRPGVVRAGTLRSGGQDAWTFDARADDTVSATLTSGMFDTVLELYGPSGDLVASNDDGGDGTNSALDGVRLGRAGRYRFVARSYSDGRGGAYAIRMTIRAGGYAPPPPPPPPTYDGDEGFYSTARRVSAGSVQVGESSNTYLSTGTAAEWTFRGRAGQTISLSLDGDGNGIDPYLELVASNGDVVESDDDGGGDLNSLIDGVRLPTTGTYRIRGRDLTDDSEGSLTLTVSSDAGRAVDGFVDLPGDGQSGRLRAGERRSVSFEGRRGDTVTVTLESDDFDPEVSLRSPRGVELARNDDYDGLNSRIDRFRLPETGTYEVLVQGHRSEGAGRYVLRIIR